ncbi:sigma-70 family RNA polymerase sigma factor [Rhabdobacter roseus]|uniref:RNA polymerase sigma factor (Sigma-70 family) n=1 Tax=Rhabdobacter roseus TaxID=1655419 RepID=A0A840TTE0_9BACT|nr:RNA polymerase sigma factor (sigma-70 family) [Rhabdobacter roseus]
MITKTQNSSLWNAFRGGDRDSFQRIYQLYVKELLSYGHKITSDVQLIEDSIHDLFIELWQSRTNLSETDSIKFYLFRSLRNKISHRHRRDVLYRASDVAHFIESLDEFSFEKQLIEHEGQEQLLRQLKKSFQLLSPRQQQALDLRFAQHFSNEEIAQIMGINYQSACKFIYSGLKVLREAVRIFCWGLAYLTITC